MDGPFRHFLDIVLLLDATNQFVVYLIIVYGNTVCILLENVDDFWGQRFRRSACLDDFHKQNILFDGLVDGPIDANGECGEPEHEPDKLGKTDETDRSNNTKMGGEMHLYSMLGKTDFTVFLIFGTKMYLVIV